MFRSILARLLRAAADVLHPEPRLTIGSYFAADQPGEVLDWSYDVAPRGVGKAADGAFAERLRAQVTVAFQSLPVIEINATSSDAEREIAQLRSRLEALAGRKLGVDIDADSALVEMNQISKELAFLGRRP